MNIRDNYVKSHKEHIEILQKWIDESDWIPEIPDNWNINRTFGFQSSQEVCIHIPFNRNMYSVVEEYFKSIGWECVADHTDESKLGEYEFHTWMTFSPNNSVWGRVVMVRFDPWADGSVCKRKQIGTTTKEIAVYEFACE